MEKQIKTAEPAAHTVASLIQFFDADIAAAIQIHYKDSPRQVTVSGVLGDMTENSYQIFYGISLKDGPDAVLLDIRKSIITANHLKGGEHVSVVGIIKTKVDQWTKGRVEIRIDVSSMRPMESPVAIEATRRNQAAIDQLKALGIRRQPFPFGRIPRVAVVLAKQSQVKHDFLYEMEKIGNKVSVEFIHASMTDVAELIAAIQSAKGDVLAIIRGGGGAEQFEVFGDISVIKAINQYSGYRVLGLGHSGDASIADLVCDYSANTPAQAGSHIRETIELYDRTINVEAARIEAKQSRQLAETKKADDLVTPRHEDDRITGFFVLIVSYWKPLLAIAAALLLAGAWLAHKMS